MNESKYQVALQSFEGPLDLLLSLIEKEKLSITEVSLAAVADQYLAYMENNEDIPLADLTSFLSVAAKLILIKSRALLPILTFTETEEEAIEDLQLQLELYALFKGGAEILEKRLRESLPITVRDTYLGVSEIYYPPETITALDLQASFINFLGESEKETLLPEQTLRKVVSLEKRIVEVQNIIRERGTVAFKEMIAGGHEKEEVIVSFLALLELIKQKYISVHQTKLFEEITIQKI